MKETMGPHTAGGGEGQGGPVSVDVGRAPRCEEEPATYGCGLKVENKKIIYI